MHPFACLCAYSIMGSESGYMQVPLEDHSTFRLSDTGARRVGVSVAGRLVTDKHSEIGFRGRHLRPRARGRIGKPWRRVACGFLRHCAGRQQDKGGH